MTEITTPNSDIRSYRLSNIDMLRGLVIVIMAIDHARDYFMASDGTLLALSDPSIDLGLYLTRWITHFCAPVFVFLAGTSVGLMSDRRSQKDLAIFVFKRGIWLIFCEIFIVSVGWTFSPLGDSGAGGALIAFLQVLWALGISMIALSGLLFLGARNCLMIGAAIILGHHLIDPIWPDSHILARNTPFWVTLYSQGSFIQVPFFVIVGYPPIPWIGVILLGFGSSYIFKMEPLKRDAQLRKIGLIFIAAFVVLRFLDFYGDPNNWQAQELGLVSTIFDFFDVTKYPPSLLFVLITIGPMAIVCSYADRFQGRVKDTLVMFGRVPFAFYVGHIYLIHTMAVFLGMYQGFEAGELMHFLPFLPQGYGVAGLLNVYLLWILVIAIMYPFCRWVAKVKSTRKDWWLSYL